MSVSVHRMARLGKAVRERRANLGMTQADVASAGGPSDTTLTGIENGTAKAVSPSTLRKLDSALHWPRGYSRALWQGEQPLPLDDEPASELSQGGVRTTTAGKDGMGDGVKPWTERMADVLADRADEFMQLVHQHPDKDEALGAAANLVAGLYRSWDVAEEAIKLGLPASLVKAWVDSGFSLLAGSGALTILARDPDFFGSLMDRYTRVNILIDDAMDQQSGRDAASLWPFVRSARSAPKAGPATPSIFDAAVDQPPFDRSNLLAAMAEPEGDRPPDDEFPADPPNDDFEGR